MQSDLLTRTIGPPTGWLDGLAVAYGFLAQIHAERGALDPALEAAEAALDTRSRIRGEDARRPFYRMSLASTTLRVGELHLLRGSPAEARPRIDDTHQILARLQDTELEDAVEPQELLEIRRRLERAQLSLGTTSNG